MSEIPVYVRVRPLNPKEVEAGHSDVWYLEDASLHCTIDGKDASNYRVNKVFRPSSTNASVFSGAAQEIVSHALQGYSGTVFAYGQTASGKTHTMMGGAGEPGLVQTALGYMYGEMARDTEADYIVRCLAMEVYNERLSCLKTDTELTIKEGRGAEPVVVGVRGGEGASSVVVSSAEEATFELEAAMSRRHVGKTKMNDQSSRSHTIFRLQIDRMPKGEAGRKAASRSTNTRSMLHLVDLAGAESMKKTGATGATAREGSNINKSLSALVRVIHCLTGGKGNEYIPFRDSKLTRLLKTSLGGNTKTAIVCCVTPASGQYDQTASTLRFAQEASKVKNDPKKCVLSGEIPPALRRTLQAMAEAQTAEAREEHKRDVAQLMEQMEALRQEAQQKEEIARLLESEREKRRAAESALFKRDEQGKKLGRRQTLCTGSLGWSPPRGGDQPASLSPNPPRKRLSSGALDGPPTSTQGKRVCFDASASGAGEGGSSSIASDLRQALERATHAETRADELQRRACESAQTFEEEAAVLRRELADAREQWLVSGGGTPARGGSTPGGAFATPARAAATAATVATATASLDAELAAVQAAKEESDAQLAALQARLRSREAEATVQLAEAQRREDELRAAAGAERAGLAAQLASASAERSAAQACLEDLEAETAAVRAAKAASDAEAASVRAQHAESLAAAQALLRD
eukprot:Rhum_TRINITY_DN14942_c11_g1::Rhum_TRINITY_DN14942_c11_g1_i4::g.126802::m.126802/K11498/CENPE; centromeric protein E